MGIERSDQAIIREFIKSVWGNTNYSDRLSLSIQQMEPEKATELSETISKLQKDLGNTGSIIKELS